MGCYQMYVYRSDATGTVSPMAVQTMRTKPTAVFMAFGTKGDVNPIAVSLSLISSPLHIINIRLETISLLIRAVFIVFFP